MEHKRPWMHRVVELPKMNVPASKWTNYIVKYASVAALPPRAPRYATKCKSSPIRPNANGTSPNSRDHLLQWQARAKDKMTWLG
ncbi:hypothetical protein SeLEV6574_g06328 [Synchytrium endobioticum]|uniref:Uncharacterized protein n=1 Tax=Synchytrium endobioticum TaxID=286115 RepID=A0A507CP92_9FUNG|nr:hypothetical protein SeLEV6574_g06328 [Synchytrium endobioticum]